MATDSKHQIMGSCEEDSALDLSLRYNSINPEASKPPAESPIPASGDLLRPVNCSTPKPFLQPEVQQAEQNKTPLRLVRPWEASPIRDGASTPSEDGSASQPKPAHSGPATSTPIPSVPGLQTIDPVYETLVCQHNMLVHELSSCIRNQPWDSRWHHLLDLYQGQVDALEINRWQSLQLTAGLVQCVQAVNTYYNQERVGLVSSVHMALQQYKQADPPTYIWSPPYINTSSQLTPMSSTNNSQHDSAYYSINSSQDNTTSNAKPSSVTLASFCARSKKFLNPVAVRLMNTWYEANWNHPYPSDEVVSRMAQEGNITVAQVKKWMANRRMRSHNTLRHNGALHPKIIKRLHHQKRVRDNVRTKLELNISAGKPTEAYALSSRTSLVKYECNTFPVPI